MTRFLTILLVTIIILTFGQYFSEAKHVKKKQKKHPYVVVVVGKVYCDTCFQGVSDKTAHFISGASVAVECKYGASVDPIFRGEAKTDEHGEFRVRLPFSVSKHTKRIEGCSVRLVKSGESYCAVASTATTTPSSIRLRSRRNGTRVFSAGFFTFRPLNQPSLCNQKPITRLGNSLHVPGLSPFPPPLKDPTTPGDLSPPLPSLPNLPALPPLPRLPSLPGNLPPIITKTRKLAENNDDQNIDARQFFFPPNPFQPPPLIPNPFQPPPAPLIPNPFQPPPAPLIPNPFQPPPAPTPLFPNPFQPPPAPTPLFPNPFQPPPAPTPLFPNPFQPPPAPPAPFFPLPKIPGLTPSPPPPPPSPPAFPFPFPPFPFRPPGSPGPPPA